MEKIVGKKRFFFWPKNHYLSISSSKIVVSNITGILTLAVYLAMVSELTHLAFGGSQLQNGQQRNVFVFVWTQTCALCWPLYHMNITHNLVFTLFRHEKCKK